MRPTALIPNFYDFLITTQGAITDIRRGEPVIMQAFGDGAPRVRLDRDGWLYDGVVWKLMLWSFYTHIPANLEPHYQDGDPRNVSLDNLIFGRVDEETGNWAPMRWREVGESRQFDRRLARRIRINETNEVFDTLQEVADHIGGYKQNVSAVLHGRLKHHCGVSFSYVDG